MAKPNNNTPRRSSRKKKHTRENTTTSETDYDSDKRDAKPRKESILTPLRQSKNSAHSSTIGKVHKKEKKLPSLAELEKMFDDASDAVSENYATNATINRNSKQVPYNNAQQPSTLQTQTPPKCEQIEIVDNNALCPSVNSNLNTYKIDLSAENNERSYLKQLEDEFSDNSNSSTKTIVYDYNALQNKSNTFSPLPSTSRDNETIMQNEILFNESQTIDTPHSSNSETMAVKINNESISCTSAPQNAVKNSNETIIIDDEQPKKNMKIDNSIIIDVDNYKVSKNITHNNGNTTTQTVHLTKSTQRPIVIKTTKPINTNPLKTFIYIRPNNGSGPSASISIEELCKLMPCERNNPTARNNDTNQSTNNTVGDNISNTTNQNIPAQSETIDIDTSSDEIEAELQSLQRKIRKYRKASKTDSRTHNYRHVACPNLNLKVVSFNMKKQEWNTLKTILQVKKESSDNTRPNIELAQQLQGSSEGHTDQSRMESIVNQEIEQLIRRESHEPINVGACPICIEPLKKDVASTLCGHLFCLRCIKSALQITGKKCPTCRKPLKGTGYHQIFI